jgi:hypothetical protein
MATEFIGCDGEYFAWLSANPTGFVLNTRFSWDDPSYMVFHRSSCGHIGSIKGHASSGGFTEASGTSNDVALGCFQFSMRNALQ